MESFADLTKRARFEELREQCRAQLSAPWTWPDLLALLAELGAGKDAGGFLAAGWWLPATVRIDQKQVDRYAALAERAIAQGLIPTPGSDYSWDDVHTLLELCDITPAQVVEGLLWVYAATMGEDMFIEAMTQVAESGSSPDP